MVRAVMHRTDWRGPGRNADAIIALLLTHGANPILRAWVDDSVPLEIALERNALALVQRLVDGGADVNVTLARGETILGRLVQGHIKLGRFNSDPEQIAAVKFVLRAGADPNGVAEVWRNMTPSIAARGIEY